MANRSVVVLSVVLATVWATARAEDWPRWRGVRGDGSWKAPPLPDRWPAAGLKRVWSVPVGGGYAGVSVADGRVYSLDRTKRPDAGKDGPDGDERVFCLDAATGKPVWEHKYPCRYGNLGGYANGPRAAPTIHDGRAYTLGAVGHLFCFDAVTGKILWSKDLVAEHKAQVPEWGFAASPLIDGDRVIVHAGAEPDGCVIAFDRRTGKEVWRALDDPAGYCTPVRIEAPAGAQLVVWTPENVHGLDPATGKRLWSVPYKVTYGVAIAGPIHRDGLLFVTGYWEGTKAIRLGPSRTDAEVVWEDNRSLRGLMAQPLYRDGHVYSIDKNIGMVCAELKTGKKLWDDHRLTPKGRNPHASIVWLGDTDRILAVNSDGELVLARLTPKGYEELSRTRAIAGKVWGHPAFAGRHLFVKSDGAEQPTRGGPFELACVELTGEN